MDPVHVLNRSYLRFTVSPSSYYSRFFKSSSTTPNSVTTVTSPLTTQKRKEPRALVDTSLKSGSRCSKRECEGGQHSFVDLVQVAPQLEIRLVCNAAVLPAFNNLVANDTKDDAVAEILNNRYIMPQESCFYMSDLGQIRNLIPALTDSGFNLIVVDPPQENSSAHRKSRYISLQLIYEEVKKNGSWICDLDLFHHRPYECLILGYSPRKVNNTDNQSKFKPVNNDHVIMSIPGDYSRKPPIADLLLEYVPGFKPSRCIELFAREIMAGWVAWGNEPLYFQDSKYFVKKMDQ
ncbi:Methyltransferase-like protein 2 [Glycine soja]|uniref:Methyltransferase-like protein 2 n=1 Tax=Glycine soja TaxID=3848 RepID=A0A445GBI9_GLYSO|nr:Methyltransferase-like protein 2 [Glycine soja]